MIKQLSKAEIDEQLEQQGRMRKKALDLLRENVLLTEKLRVLELRLEDAEKKLQSLRISEHWNGITH